jgi:hypothetical protein
VNNQPAFPSPYDDAEGMTLRDYFAAKAMQVFIADQRRGMAEDAKDAYAMADAMLRAREQ